MEQETDLPRVSIGVPVYNASRYLAEALERLAIQDLQGIEVIITDNASTDSTAEIAQQFVARDPRFRYYRNDRNVGLPANFNRCLSLARAPLFMWHAYDDGVEPSHISRCVDALDADANAVLAFSRATFVSSDGRYLGDVDDLNLDFGSPAADARVREFLKREVWQAVGYGSVIRTGLLREVGGLPPYFGGDVVLGIELAIRGPFLHIDERLFRIRQHDDQTNKLQGRPIAEQIRTFQPEREITWAFPQWWLNLQMLAVVSRAEIPLRARVHACLSIARWWTVPHWRFFPYDVKRNLQALGDRRRTRRLRRPNAPSERPRP